MGSLEERAMSDVSWNAGRNPAPARQSELMQIMRDAVQHVLDRPDTRRGPYILSDTDLQSIKEATAKEPR